MKRLDPSITQQSITLIPRRTLGDNPLFTLTNEATKISVSLAFAYAFIDGLLMMAFDLDTEQGTRYQMELSDDQGIVYRGKAIATEFETMTPTHLYYE